MGKGEIARNMQFLLFPQCFLLNQIIVSPLIQIFAIISLFAAALEELKIGISGEGLNCHLHGQTYSCFIFLTLYDTITTFNDPV